MCLYKSWGLKTERTVIYNNFSYVKGLCEVCMFYTYIFVRGWYLYYTNNLKLQGSKFQIIYAQLNMINIYSFIFRPKLYIVPLRLLFHFNHLISYPDHIFLSTSYFVELFQIQISFSPSLFLCVSPLTVYPPSKAKISTNISFYWTFFFLLLFPLVLQYAIYLLFFASRTYCWPRRSSYKLVILKQISIFKYNLILPLAKPTSVFSEESLKLRADSEQSETRLNPELVLRSHSGYQCYLNTVLD